MKKNKKKIIFFTSLSIIILSVAIFIAYSQINQTIIKIDNQVVPVSTGSISLMGINGVYETLYLGNIVTDNDRVEINNINNENEIRIYNFISGGSTLIMESSAYSQGGGVSDNYIKSTFDFPKGTLTVRCVTSSNGRYYEDGKAICQVLNEFQVKSIGSPSSATGTQYIAKDETTTLVLDEPKTLTFILNTDGSYGTTSEASIRVNFVEDTSGSGSGYNNISIGDWNFNFSTGDNKIIYAYLFTLIIMIGVVILIIWQRRKKPKK